MRSFLRRNSENVTISTNDLKSVSSMKNKREGECDDDVVGKRVREVHWKSTNEP